MSKAVSYAQWFLESYCIGLKLRSLRNSKRLTLSRLALETGLSTALLSKLETDRMIPTLPALAAIARFYGVGMDYFFSEPAHHRLPVTRKALTRPRQSPRPSLHRVRVVPRGNSALSRAGPVCTMVRNFKDKLRCDPTPS